MEKPNRVFRSQQKPKNNNPLIFKGIKKIANTRAKQFKHPSRTNRSLDKLEIRKQARQLMETRPSGAYLCLTPFVKQMVGRLDAVAEEPHAKPYPNLL